MFKLIWSISQAFLIFAALVAPLNQLSGVVDLDVLLLAGAKSVSSDSDACLACRAFARVFFSKPCFSSSAYTVNREIFVLWNFRWKNFRVENFS